MTSAWDVIRAGGGECVFVGMLYRDAEVGDGLLSRMRSGGETISWVTLAY